MWILLALLVALLPMQRAFARRARRRVIRMMGPADLWEDEDVDRWLELIEPFPLERAAPK